MRCCCSDMSSGAVPPPAPRRGRRSTHFWVGMIKAPVFAFVIALVGCFEGLRVSGSAESVGRLTTQSVVEVDLPGDRVRRRLLRSCSPIWASDGMREANRRRAPRSADHLECAAWSTGSASRSCTTISISTSGAARCWASSAARAPASRCCCAPSSASTARRPGAIEVFGEDTREPRASAAWRASAAALGRAVPGRRAVLLADRGREHPGAAEGAHRICRRR